MQRVFTRAANPRLAGICWRTCFFAVSVAICGLLSKPAFGQPVAIADPNLEAVVREILQLPDGELTRADMARLETVSARRRNIATLEGFVGATNLGELDLGFNGLSDVRLPDDLLSLVLLNLQGNPINRLEAAGVLPSLLELNAAECLLTDTAFLAQMPALSSLNLQANDLEVLSLPGNQTSLQILDLGYNRLRDLSFLGLLPGLRKLWLDDNGLTELSFPGPMPELHFLSLAVNRLTDLSALAQAPNLETLGLASNRSTEFLFPPGLTRLTWLNLGENALSTLELPEDMANLLALYLDDNRFASAPAAPHARATCANCCWARRCTPAISTNICLRANPTTATRTTPTFRWFQPTPARVS